MHSLSTDTLYTSRIAEALKFFAFGFNRGLKQNIYSEEWGNCMPQLEKMMTKIAGVKQVKLVLAHTSRAQFEVQFIDQSKVIFDVNDIDAKGGWFVTYEPFVPAPIEYVAA